MQAVSDRRAASEKSTRSSEMPPAKRAATSAKAKTPAKKAAASKTTKAATKPAPKPATTRTARTASTATARRSGTAAQTKRTDEARAAAARVKRAASTDTGVIPISEQLVKGNVSPKDVVILTRERIQETLDDAASRGRVTRKDANELLA